MALFNDDSVLIRTEEGENAARQPRRVASSQARAALLLLDGELSVGEMKRRFGDSLQVDDALMELLRDGLAVDRDDAITDPEDEDLLSVDPLDMPEPPTEMPPDPDLSLPPGFKVSAGGEGAAGRAEPGLRQGAGEAVLDALEPDESIDEGIAAAYADRRKRRPMPREPLQLGLWVDRARFRLTRMAHAAVPLALVVGIALALVLLWHSPEWFRGAIEARARAVAGVEVAIERLTPAWSDGPALELARVSLGSPSGDSLLIGRIELAPDWTALLGGGDGGMRLRIEGIDGHAAELAEAFNRADFGRAGVQRLRVENLRLLLNGDTQLALNGEGEFAEGVLQALKFSPPGLRVAIRVALPVSWPMELSGNASDWRVPFLGGVQVETLNFSGLLSDEGMQVVDATAALHGGRVSGTLGLDWREGVSAQGEFRLDGVRLERLMPAMRPAGDLEGALAGTLSARGEARSFDELSDAMAFSGELEVERGRLGGLDIGAIMRERGSGLVQGGATRFDSLALNVRMDMKRRELRTQIRRLQAGNLHVGGAVTIDADDVLSGRLLSTLSTRERSVSLPVLVSGSLGSPALRLDPEVKP